MKIRKRQATVAAVVISLTAAVSGYSAIKGDGVRTQGESTVVPETTTPGFTLAAQGTTVKISNAGNIIGYESPPGFEHIGVGTFSEGYILCYTKSGNPETNTYDTGSSFSGWNTPTVSGNVVTRTTSDGLMQLVQSYQLDGPNHALTVTNKITNLAVFGLQLVTFRRQVDFDTDTGGALGFAGFQNYHSSTNPGSVFAWNVKEGPGVPVNAQTHMMILSNNKGGSNAALVTGDILDSTCQADTALTPQTAPFHGDYGDTLRYSLGTMTGHKTKTIVVRYQRS